LSLNQRIFFNFRGILIILTILVIISTGIEIYNIIYERNIREENNYFGDLKFGDEELFKVNPYYYTFSLVTNTRSLLAKNNRFAALDTLRMFLILHFYVLHFYNTMASMGIVTLKRSLKTYPMLGLELDRYSTIRNSVFIDALFTMRLEIEKCFEFFLIEFLLKGLIIS
jgi:hypothetical protein